MNRFELDVSLLFWIIRWIILVVLFIIILILYIIDLFDILFGKVGKKGIFIGSEFSRFSDLFGDVFLEDLFYLLNKSIEDWVVEIFVFVFIFYVNLSSLVFEFGRSDLVIKLRVVIV